MHWLPDATCMFVWSFSRKTFQCVLKLTGASEKNCIQIARFMHAFKETPMPPT